MTERFTSEDEAALMQYEEGFVREAGALFDLLSPDVKGGLGEVEISDFIGAAKPLVDSMEDSEEAEDAIYFLAMQYRAAVDKIHMHHPTQVAAFLLGVVISTVVRSPSTSLDVAQCEALLVRGIEATDRLVSRHGFPGRDKFHAGFVCAAQYQKMRLKYRADVNDLNGDAGLGDA